MADRLLTDVVSRDRTLLTGIVAITLVGTAAGLLLPNALAGAVDDAVAGRSTVRGALWLLTLAATTTTVAVLGEILAVRVTSSATAWLRGRLVDRLLRLGERSPFAHGDAVSRLTGDCSVVGQIAVIYIGLLMGVLTGVGAVVALFLVDWMLVVVFLLAVPAAILLAQSHLRQTASDVEAYQRISGELSARLLDAVTGLRTIAASGTAEREAERVLRPLPELGEVGVAMWRTQARMIWRAGLLLPTVELAVLTAAGFGVAAGRVSVGQMLAVLGYVALGMALVSQIPLLTSLARARASAARLNAVLDTPPAPAREVVPGDGRIRLHAVTVGSALSDVDLSVSPGTFVAVVGHSGAGKSVLAGVIGGTILPDSGEVLVEGEVGQAFERPALLGATVRESVAYGVTTSETELRAACEAAHVHDVVVRLPSGYDTPLAQTPLSGGEAQRLGLARAIVRDPDVLVLDDATASLDTVTEAAVEDAIASALPGRTRLVVTHRAATAQRADLVIWLDQGRVRATGPHDRLWEHEDYRRVFCG